MPGDFTPPSRFVRAAIYSQSAGAERHGLERRDRSAFLLDDKRDDARQGDQQNEWHLFEQRVVPEGLGERRLRNPIARSLVACE